MKTVLILSLMALAGTTSWSLNERVSSITTGVQRQKPRRVLLLPTTSRKDIQRLFYLKHLLELNCLRHICNGHNCKGSRCPAAVKSSDRNQHDYNRMGSNQYREQPPYRRRYPSEERMIVVPPNFYFINPRLENLSQMTQKNPQGANLVKQNTENVIYIQFPPQSEESRTAEDQNVGDESSYPSRDMHKSDYDSSSKSRKTTSHSYWQESPPNQVRQYEVEEIIDEDPIYQERNPFFVIPKATEEVRSRSDASKNDRYNGSTKEAVKKFSNHKSRELVDEKVPHTRKEEAKYIRIMPPAKHHPSRVQKTQAAEQAANSPTTTVSILKKRPSDLLESLEFLTDQPETDKPAPENRNPATVSFSEIQATAEVLSKGLRELITAAKMDSDREYTFPEDSSTAPSVVNMVRTVEYFSESTINKADMTTPDFQEFTDHPLLFDLFAKVKPKDPETVWKNSRKMHFGDLPKTTKASHDEQRRSDILINDDYYDYENGFSTSNYLEKLKENSSSLSFDLQKNPSEGEIIPLIPVVINDLRENKIPQEALAALSKLFGKYWPSVMALSNSTNLDMLPLLKMKNEKDLESIMESFRTETSEEVTTTTTTERMEMEFSKNLYYDLYDYDVDDYKDLYKDFGGIQEVRPTDKRKRFEKDLVL